MKKTKAKKIAIILITLIALMSLSVIIYASTIEKTTIICEDNNLYNALKSALSKYIMSTDNSTKTIIIPTESLNSITELDISNSQITNLSGIEAFANLTSLNLSKNNITDISPISNINTISNLSLNDNKVSNISLLSNKSNLTELYLANAGISNLSFLSTLSKIQVLDLSNNNISSLQPIQGLQNITKLNVSKNKSLTVIDHIKTHTELVELDISNSGITDIDGIEALRNLESLNVGNLTLGSLDPIVKTYRDEETLETTAYLNKLQKLDMRYTKSLSFSKFQYFPDLKELYMQGNNISSLSGIARLESLTYLNLEDNNISNIEPMIQWKMVNGVETIEYSVKATQMSFKKNNITDLSTFYYLEQDITYLDLSENAIYNINPLKKHSLSEGIHLENQNVTFAIYDKKAEVDQYIILPNILQETKIDGSIVYSTGTLETTGVTLNPEEIYQTPGYYNIIIDYDKTSSDTLQVKIHGGNADGSIMNYKISTATSSIDTLLFPDANLDAAIYDYLRTHKKESTYLARIPKIINITYSEIAATKELDLSNHNIKDLTGLASFSNLTYLNLSQNDITTIDELKYCTKINQLNVSNTPIKDNNTAIELMTSLAQLDLSNTGMTNINSINNLVDGWIAGKKRITLTELNISNNGLLNIDEVSKITSLQKLYISSNKISDAAFLETLINLDTLNMSGNQIKDISVLSVLTNLKSLYMSNNQIKEVSPVSNIAITELDFSGNRVKDISTLSKMTSLTNLYMSNNQIEDISAIQNLLIKNEFLAKQQKIVKVLAEDVDGNVTIELPQIFKAAKTTGSKVYTGSDFEVKYCTLSEDGTSITVNADELGDNVAMVIINGGTANATTLAIASPLKATIQYDITEKTNQDVNSSISFSRSNVTILNNDGNDKYTFLQNGEFTFEYIDDYGFEGTAKAEVNWIDKTAPTCSVNQQIVDGKIIVTITSNEEIKSLEGWTLADNKLSISKTYSEDANEKITISDMVGNTVDVQIEVKIDKQAPVITGVENGKKYNQSVIPTIQDENLNTIILTKDGVQVENYQSGNKITEVGIYVLTATDTFGNNITVSFEIESLSDIIISTTLSVDEEKFVIKGIQPNTTITQIKAELQNEMEYDIIDQEGNILQDTKKIGTGYQIKMANGKKYTLVVWGDLNGDGNVKLSDLSKLKLVIVGKNSLQGVYQDAADLNGDGNVKLSDLSKLKLFIVTGNK